MRRGRGGRWECRPYLGTAPGGRRIRPQRSWPGDMPEGEALAAAREWAAALGAFADEGVWPTVDGLVTAYVAQLTAAGAPWNTVKSYGHWRRRYVSPYVGRVPASELTAVQVEGMYACLQEDLGVSNSTVRLVHSLMRRSYRWGVRRLTPSSPMESVTPPRPMPARKSSLSPLDAARVRDELVARLDALGWGAGGAAADAAPYMAALTSLGTALRVGEECALRAVDVDFASSTLRVDGTVTEGRGGGLSRGEPKSPNSVRALVMGETTEGHLARWARATGAGRRPDAPLFPGRGGGWMRPADCSAAFSALARDLGLPAGATFHILRHTHASMLLARGESLPAVAARIGDTKRAAMDYYGHAMPGADRQLAESFDAALGRF